MEPSRAMSGILEEMEFLCGMFSFLVGVAGRPDIIDKSGWIPLIRKNRNRCELSFLFDDLDLE